jgi:23S rRNA (cytosine1962-C5)-methyltransferase
MDSLPTILVSPGEADRILAGHPWVYDSAVLRATVSDISDGAVVQLKDHRKRFLGVGLYNSKSKIRVRVLSPERVEINHAFFRERIEAANEVRKRRMPAATSYRVVNSESDFLSGLVIDKYEDTLVVQTSALGMDQRKETIVAVLEKIFSPRGIVERNDASFRKFEGMGDANGVIRGDVPSPSEIRLNGLKFQVDLLHGHKTGLYLDQQANYQNVGELARGGVMLDCFCFLGGFAIHAARSGAARVIGLDQSQEATKAATANAAANGFADRCEFNAVNVFDWFKANTAVPAHEKVVPRFDCIVLDPPSFTRTRAAVGDALRGYKEIHLRALKLLKRNGILATFCCSHHVDAELFEEVVLAAAFDARRVLRRIASYSQSPDHPIIPSIAETEYLKGYAYEVVR